MLLLDVNVVLAAHRGDHPHHADVRQWFDEMLAGGDDFAVPDAVWASFLRLATSHRIFEVPSAIADAFGFVEATVAQNGCVRAGPGPRHSPSSGVCARRRERWAISCPTLSSALSRSSTAPRS